jgi:hypothetical protein
MEAYRFKTHLDSETLHVTGLKGLADKNVEVIILVEADEGERPPHKPPRARRKPGTAKGEITFTEDFADPLDEETLRLWYGEASS